MVLQSAYKTIAVLGGIRDEQLAPANLKDLGPDLSIDEVLEWVSNLLQFFHTSVEYMYVLEGNIPDGDRIELLDLFETELKSNLNELKADWEGTPYEAQIDQLIERIDKFVALLEEDPPDTVKGEAEQASLSVEELAASADTDGEFLDAESIVGDIGFASQPVGTLGVDDVEVLGRVLGIDITSDLKLGLGIDVQATPIADDVDTVGLL